MLNLDESQEKVSTERVEIFSLNGTSYTAPATPGAAFGLRYLEFKREHGEDAAVDYLLSHMLGQDGYAVLTHYEDLTDAQLLTVFSACLELALGAMEDPKGV